MKPDKLLVMVIPFLVVGCMAPRPEGLVKDTGAAYVDAREDSAVGSAGKAKVAVFTSTYEAEEDQALAALLDAKIAELLTSSSSFEIAERTTLEALKFEDVLSGTDTGATVPTKSDYILLAKIISGLRRKILVFQSDRIETDDRIHRRSDLMGHIGQKRSLGRIGSFGFL